ncbi:MAG: ComEC family competence protein [Leptolinea sp.]|jgi:competence protein ComEC|nr:ComEC family competence protein [Leptolinea sp.]
MPLLWISIAFVAGAVVSLIVSTAWPVPAVLAGLFILLVIFEQRLFSRFVSYTRLRASMITPLCLLPAAIFGGMLRADLGKPAASPQSLSWYNGQAGVTLRAVASQPVENHDKSTLLTVSAESISTGGSDFIPVKGEAVILLPAGRNYEYGDRLEVTGKLETPPERADFSYRQYLENRGVFSYLSYPRITIIGRNTGNPLLAVVFTLRDRIAQVCEQVMPQPEAAFLSGMLVGRDEEIPDDLKQAFQNTGTSHLVAISGFNITILSGLILALASRLLPRGWSVLASAILLCAYAIMAGASPSVVRAAIMGVLAIIGLSIGRTRTAVNSLGLAAAGMVLVNPLILRDIGFQLSFAATAGILLIGAPLNDKFVKKMTGPARSPETNLFWRSLGDFVIITLSAQAATLPFLLYHFYRYPLIGLLVNPLVLPVQPAAMVLGGISAVAGMLFLPLGKLLGMLAWIPLAYTTRLVEGFSSFSRIGMIDLHVNLWQAVVLGCLLTAAVILKGTLLKQLERWLYWCTLIGLTAILLFQLNALYHRPDGKLHIRIFRQANDLSALILSPGGQRLLVTNRPGDKDLKAFVDRQMPVLDRRLAALILPNPTATTTNGLEDVLLHFNPEWLLVNTRAGGKRVQNALFDITAGSEAPVQSLDLSARFDLGAGAILTIERGDDSGARLTILWGKNLVNFEYGESTGIDTSGQFTPYRPGVLILDHADSLSNSGAAEMILTADIHQKSVVNMVTVPDGGWLEICSDGEAIQILEKAIGFD